MPQICPFFYSLPCVKLLKIIYLHDRTSTGKWIAAAFIITSSLCLCFHRIALDIQIDNTRLLEVQAYTDVKVRSAHRCLHFRDTGERPRFMEQFAPNLLIDMQAIWSYWETIKSVFNLILGSALLSIVSSNMRAPWRKSILTPR